MNPKRAETKAGRMAIYRAKQARRPKPKEAIPKDWPKEKAAEVPPTPLARQDLNNLFCL